jgi:hypothetical protein
MEDARALVPGVDYPRTFQEVDEWFRSDAAYRDYVPALARRVHLPALRMDRQTVVRPHTTASLATLSLAALE